MGKNDQNVALVDKKAGLVELSETEKKQEELENAVKNLTGKQALFVKGYFENKGNATRAASTMVEVGMRGGKGCESLLRVSGSYYLANPNVKKTISGMIALHASADSVTAWFNAQRFNAESEMVQFRSNEALAKMLGLFPSGGRSTQHGAGVQILISLPDGASTPKAYTQDIEFSAKDSEIKD